MFNNKIKVGIFLSSLLLLSGCSNKFNENNKTEKNVIYNIENLKYITSKGFYQNDTTGINKELTLPAYIGPSDTLSLEEYNLIKYSHKNLLFSNNGLKNNIILYLNNSDISSLNQKANSYGFKNIEHMFDYLLKFYGSKNKLETEYSLKYLYEQNLISDLDTFTVSNIQKENKILIEKLYGNYASYENLDSVKILPTWGFWIDNKYISFSENDYKPYTFVILLMKEVLEKNNDNGVKIYGF